MAEVFIFHVSDDRTLDFRQTEPIMLEDNNVTEFMFRIPKTLNELDVTSWAWWFVYKNANGDKYSSPLLLTDDADEPDLYSNATYVVDYGFTQKAGRVKVALEALNVGTGDAPTNEWHTKTYIIDVNDTLQGNQIEFKPSEVDIISGMLQSTLNQIREMIETGGGGTSDDIENVSSVSGATVTDALNSLSDEITSLEGGAPTPAATVSAMVDTTKIYLYTGSETGYTSGHWYYYSGGQWVDGGAYGEAASMSAGVKEALLACFRKVAWIDENGQTYYANLYNELYPPIDLLSITVTYTQSGAVYDTATLDDLKPDLVVTANYSDGTSETVTTYTLSGTLTVGTSTITVSYSGKSATFTVNVTQEPPYTFYDYLQGDGKAYINTGLTASVYNTLSYDHEIKAARYNSATTKAIYGARQQWGSANARQLWWNSGAYGVNFCASSTTSVADASSNAVPITVKTTRDKKIYRDGVEVTYTAGNIGSITHTGPITMFAECTGGQGSGYVAIADTNAFAGAFSACRIYYLKIWDADGELVAYIRPALRKSDNAIGMYDSVRDVFLENANSTGAFSLGNE